MQIRSKEIHLNKSIKKKLFKIIRNNKNIHENKSTQKDLLFLKHIRNKKSQDDKLTK